MRALVFKKVFFLALISQGGRDFSHRILFERSIWRSKVKLSKNLVKGYVKFVQNISNLL